MNTVFEEWNNGRLYAGDISLIPSGYRLGDGVFETVRTYRGKCFRLGAHVSRLLTGARSIGFRNLPDNDTVSGEINRALEKKEMLERGEEWIVRPTFFSDGSSWGFTVPVESWRPPVDFDEILRISVGISEYPHPGSYLIPPSAGQQVKWISRGPLSHALRNAKETGWEEALLLDSEQRVIEGTRSNVFMVENELIIAPGKNSGAFPGITRDVVVGSAERNGMEVVDRPIKLEELRDSGELFLTSTLLGVASVLTLFIGKTVFDKPSYEISKLLMADFSREVAEECHTE